MPLLPTDNFTWEPFFNYRLENNAKTQELSLLWSVEFREWRAAEMSKIKTQREWGNEGHWYTSMFSLHLLFCTTFHTFTRQQQPTSFYWHEKGKRKRVSRHARSSLFAELLCNSESDCVKSSWCSKIEIQWCIKAAKHNLTRNPVKQFVTAVYFACYPNKSISSSSNFYSTNNSGLTSFGGRNTKRLEISSVFFATLAKHSHEV